MNSLVITPIQLNSLADIVFERLREAIVRGQFEPGEKLSETVVASILGVSRSPVREALLRLQSEGLVVSQTNRSTVVWQPTEADVVEIYTLRTSIETLACELVADKLTEKDYAALNFIIQSEAETVEKGDWFKLIHEDKVFHEYLVRLSEHSRLYEIWRTLMGQWEMLSYIRFRTNPKTVPPSVVEDHQAIVDALRTKDRARLDEVNRSINQRVMNEILQQDLPLIK